MRWKVDCISAILAVANLGKARSRESPPSPQGLDQRGIHGGIMQGGVSKLLYVIILDVTQDISPPEPVQRPEPTYAQKARAMAWQGTVVVRVGVNVKGSVEEARVVRPAGLGLDPSALRTARSWKFKSATRDGKPVPVRIMLSFSFRLGE
jgi:TonB family protein